MPKIWIAHDIGRTLNPVLARGQVIGGVYMGLCEALMEEQAFRRLPAKLSSALVHRMPSMLEYKSLTALDMPDVDVALIEDPDPNCPFGAKEVGQGPLLPVMPALANAIFDAVGVRIDEIPVTPDKVLRALELKNSGQEPESRSGSLSRRSLSGADLRRCRRMRAATARKAEGREEACCGCRGLSTAPRARSRRRRRSSRARARRAMLIAGGTDLLPNMKRRHQTPKVLVSLRGIASLKECFERDGRTSVPVLP